MNEQQVAELIREYNDNTLSPDKKTALTLWYVKFVSESDTKLTVEKEEYLAAKLKSNLPLQYPKPTIKLWKRIITTAAVLAIVFSAGLWFAQTNADDIAPGKTGAILTLANGKKIRLGNLKTGKVAIESGVKISKTANGQLVYEVLNTTAGSVGQMNSLETSIGEQAQVQLPDGTIVYLNAASILKYPASFSDSAKRIVELTGEGYFEVAKAYASSSTTRLPFIVKTGAQEVEVLGTHFNINSYSDNHVIKTTLLEGSVNVKSIFSSSGEAQERKLKPGEQASVTTNGIAIENVETAYIIAWKNGYFMFNHESLEDIMLKLAKWYKIDVVYKDPDLKKKVFFGSISKFENISKVLGIMERTHVASFDIKGNKVIISKQ